MEYLIEVKMNDKSDNAVKAIADVTFIPEVGEFTVSGFKVIQQDKKKSPWVAMPEVRFKDDKGEYKGVRKLYPSKVFVKNISDLILEEYAKSMSKENGTPF